jgi:hypothetical protein
MYIQASTPASCNWISPLYGTCWNTRKCIVPLHISCFSVVFNFTIFQTTCHSHFMMKWKYNIRIHHESTENGMPSVSQLRWMCLFATLERVIFSPSWHWGKEQWIFPVYPFLKGHVFAFLSFSLKTGVFEVCNKDVKLVSRELNDFIALSWFMAPENAKIFQVLEAGVVL